MMMDDLVLTLCKYDLFVLSWSRVRRGSTSLELLMCGGRVCSILLLPHVMHRDNRCVYMAHVCCIAHG